MLLVEIRQNLLKKESLMKKINVTVVVSVKNEEINLPKCLKELSDFSEVIVVDSNSTDSTPKIVDSFGFKLINFSWNGKYPKKRNWTLLNVKIKNDWILFLDADEFLTVPFKKELSAKILTKTHCGFWLNYNNFFMGKEIRYGDKMKKLALFKKDAGLYEKIEEDSWSHLDMEIHEHPILNGSVGQIKSPIVHNDYKGLEHYIQRHNSYSTWEAKRFISLSKKNNTTNLNNRQLIKYKLISLGLLPVVYFFASFVLKLGFLDGKYGYRLAKYKSSYFFQVQTKIIELKKNKFS